MGTFSALVALCAGNSPVTGEFPSQRPLTRSFDVFLDPRQNKRFSKQSRGWWFETPSSSLWRHCNGLVYMILRHGLIIKSYCFFVWDVIAWWRHQMETFSALLALCAGNSPVPVNSPHKGQWRGALMFSLIYAWINDWVNNREAGDLIRQRGHYDVIVIVRPCPNFNIEIRTWMGNDTQ